MAGLATARTRLSSSSWAPGAHKANIDATTLPSDLRQPVAKAVEVGEDRGCLPERNLAEVAAGLGLRCAVKLCAELFRQRHI
eukprot:CAMPEP_0202749386 /NCGR_PEP_ID=MMETSP1388-20130828/10479_1 /ASSEMBLY_ACC=CAM_ASM_000864 /TAXON_ID=37098 /ORGANISM="Isochrysis sp, Strain CCMP1244" /LENGTH=81 /DNA_ID=CAMNT_0049416873 /DNA_START=103 /DNA_END=348 /DNA_ORIENTATION=-